MDSYRYISGCGSDFNVKLKNTLDGYKPEGIVVRLVFFIAAGSSEEYFARKESIAKAVEGHFGSPAPVWSCISQAPLENGDMVVEVQEMPWEPDYDIINKSHNGTRYVVVRSPALKKICLGGVTAPCAGISGRDHCRAVFAKIEDIFVREGMSVSNIVRQWNYIPGITAVENDSQHYQDFNNARSRFYASVAWGDGYPAATGIGSSYGGVVIDLEAIKPLKKEAVVIRKIDNRLQVPAFNYSCEVLSGGGGRRESTPKFERAKAVIQDGNGMIYLSGTAAIRGEQSLEGAGIERQTTATLENMAYLVSKDALLASGIPCRSSAGIVLLRVYVKNPGQMRPAREIISARYPGIPAVYLHADICRDNLLVEIEGIAVIK